MSLFDLREMIESAIPVWVIPVFLVALFAWLGWMMRNES